MTNALTLINVNASYADNHVLHNVSIDVPRGCIVAILGANGAGKSSTLRAISGQIRNTSGSILLDGQEMVGKAACQVTAAGIAHCPEGRQIFGPMTVLENILLGAFTRRDQDGIDADMERMFGLFPRLKERASQLGGTLSGGEQQMLAIARALMLRPRVLLLDEPSMGLAPNIVNDVFTIIEKLRADGLTIVLVEQFARRALAIADYGYVLARGEVVMSGSSADLSSDAGLVASYLS
ncbi:MAG TPA: ABC transporter ATP-binding protein [Janthinobacterium sp.]|nr:ABC transporter ATP-binding protein [Janthinobacterium sp.]